MQSFKGASPSNLDSYKLRQRVRPEMKIKTVENCPACDGKGEVEAVLIVDEIEDKLNHVNY